LQIIYLKGVDMNDLVEKNVRERAERLAERWRRALACHGVDVAKSEIDFDIKHIESSIYNNAVCFPELTIDDHNKLLELLLKMKEMVFSKRFRKNKKVMSFRISEETRFKLEYLAERGGVTMTTVIESLVMEANRFDIPVPRMET
tara:strand:+ start:175 stop:609 length:435 start_codon:yes stop_codon:yes gene_type:complete